MKKIYFILIFILLGSVSTAVPALAGTVIDVTQAPYYAVPGDGIEDTAAIQAAIAAAGENDVVYLPAGVFITNRLYPKSNITIQGAGQDQTTLKAVASIARNPDGYRIMYITGQENITIRDLKFYGGFAGESNCKYGIVAYNSKNLLLEDLSFANVQDNGIMFSGRVSDSVINQCTFVNIGRNEDDTYAAPNCCAVRISSYSTRIRVTNNYMRHLGDGGIRVNSGCEYITITGNRIEDSSLPGNPAFEGLAIELWRDVKYAVIEDNEIDHFLSLAGAKYVSARRNIIGSYSQVYKYLGIECCDTAYAVIEDNEVRGDNSVGAQTSGASPSPGTPPGPQRFVYWGGNRFDQCGTFGVELSGDIYGIRYFYFYDNEFTNTLSDSANTESGRGVRLLKNIKNVVFDNCRIAGNKAVGIQFCEPQLIDQVSFRNCVIENNLGNATDSHYDAPSVFEWENNIVRNNASNAIPQIKPYRSQRPAARMIAPQKAATGAEVRFENASTDDGMIAYALWSFGDGIPSSDLKNGFYTYAKPGIYTVTLIVWDDEGIGERVSTQIEIVDDLESPESFLPQYNEVRLSGAVSGNHEAYKLYNMGLDSYPDNNAPEVYYDMDLGSGNAKRITLIRYYARHNVSKTLGNNFFGSVDGVDYVPLQALCSKKADGWVQLTVTNPYKFRYLRWQDEVWPAMNSLEWYGTDDGAAFAEEPLTGRFYGTGKAANDEVPDRSSQKNWWLSFDDDPSTYPEMQLKDGILPYLALDLGAGNAARLTRIQIVPLPDDPQNVLGIWVEGSNDGVNYVPVLQIPNDTQMIPHIINDVAAQMPEPSVSYRYYRFPGLTNVSELKFFGVYDEPTGITLSFSDNAVRVWSAGGIGSSVVMVAGYSENRLILMRHFPVAAAPFVAWTREVAGFNHIPEENIKVMLWSDLADIRPLAS